MDLLERIEVINSLHDTHDNESGSWVSCMNCCRPLDNPHRCLSFPIPLRGIWHDLTALHTIIRYWLAYQGMKSLRHCKCFRPWVTTFHELLAPYCSIATLAPLTNGSPGKVCTMLYKSYSWRNIHGLVGANYHPKNCQTQLAIFHSGRSHTSYSGLHPQIAEANIQHSSCG